LPRPFQCGGIAIARVGLLHYSPKPPWTAVQLINAFESLGATVDYLIWDYVEVGIGGECSVRHRRRCMEAYPAILLRSIGRVYTPEQLAYREATLSMLEDRGVTVVNPVKASFTARNKLYSLYLLARCGLPVPETVVTENVAAALRRAREWGRIVIKPIVGSLGLGSFLADNVDMAYYIFNLLAKLNQPLYIQRYVEKRYNSDIRVFVVDGVAVAAARRLGSSWKTNVAQGARTEPLSVDGEYSELAVKAVECLGLLYAGVDIAEDSKNGYVIFEVNASPLWRGLQRATGVNPAVHIAAAVLRRLKR